MFSHLHDSAFCFLLQALPYVALLIVMMFFIYAVIGMQVRCEVRRSGSNFHCFEHFFALCFLFFERDRTQVMGKIMRVFPTQLKSALFQYLLLAPQTELSPPAKQDRNPCSGPSPLYQDLITRYDWPVKNAIVDLPIRMKENS